MRTEPGCEDVLSPEEAFEEAFGELDQLDAAMLQLAPRKRRTKKSYSCERMVLVGFKWSEHIQIQTHASV